MRTSQNSIVSPINQFNPADIFPPSWKSGKQCGYEEPEYLRAVLLRGIFKGFRKETPGPFKNEKLDSGKQRVVAWQRSLLAHT